jgi:hypothetical protein
MNDDLVKRLLISEERWYDKYAPSVPVEARNSVMRDAAARIEELEKALTTNVLVPLADYVGRINRIKELEAELELLKPKEPT